MNGRPVVKVRGAVFEKSSVVEMLMVRRSTDVLSLFGEKMYARSW